MRKLALILLYFLVVASLFARNIPLMEASDEAEHFIYIHEILETGALPIIQSRDAMANQTDPILRWNNQSHHAPLYYLLGALAVSWSERADLADYLEPNELIFLRNTVLDNPNKWLHRYGTPRSDTHLALYILRALNILIGMGTLCMVYYAAKQLQEGETIALLATLVTASIPTFIAVNASVTNDALLIFLYSAGIAWMLRIWRLQSFTWRDAALISLILAGSSLSKLTGVSLFGLIFAGLVWGAWLKYWSWKKAAQAMLMSLVVTAILAAWWYWRNFTLYGDPLALSATASIWGRETPFTGEMLPNELARIGNTFWMMVGYLHFPVFAPDWFYWILGSATLLGVISAWSYGWQRRMTSFGLLFLAFGLVLGMLLYGTRSVDISYGRLLLPAIAAFAPLMVLGWHKRLTSLLLVPLIGMSFYVPLVILPQAYPTLDFVDALPDDATPVNWTSGTLEIVGVRVNEAIVHPNDELHLDFYFRGNHPDNPALLVTAVDSIQVARLDHTEIYPAMADMRYLPENQLFHVPITLQIPEPETSLPPRSVTILIEWVNLEDDVALVFDSGKSLLELQGASFSDPSYTAPSLTPLTARFAEIAIDSYQMPESVHAGESINLAFVWNLPQELVYDWTLTIQLFDDEGNFVSQSDGVLWWYPTSAWIANLPFEDIRSLELPPDLAAGELEIRVGWYREENGQFIRMPVIEGESVDNLSILPQRLLIEAQ